MNTNINNNHLIASEGKVLRRLSDGWIAGEEIYLGYTYYMYGDLLPEPILELPEHYEEIDEPLLNEVTDEAFDVPAEPAMLSLLTEEPVSEPEGRTTLADLLSRAMTEIEGLKKEVAELKKGSTPIAPTSLDLAPLAEWEKATSCGDLALSNCSSLTSIDLTPIEESLKSIKK